MNITVVSRISRPDREITLPAWDYCKSLGHSVTVQFPGCPRKGDKPDVIIAMGLSLLNETFDTIKKFPGVPLFCFNWDAYEYVWEKGQEGKKQAYHPSRGVEYDYIKYGELLHQATRIWVPSFCTGIRTTQWWGIDPKKITRILSSCPWWDYDNVTDEGYIYCALREIPDKWWGKLEEACRELQLPLVMTKHGKDFAQYQKALAGCRFIVAPLYELSTGGLSLMEAYYLGKPVLINGSQWNGGRDYFGERANYFKDCDYESLKWWLKLMYEEPFKVPSDHKEYITSNFSDQKMIDAMLLDIQGVIGHD